MLSRATSNVSHRPQRAKSSSSIKNRATECGGASIDDANIAHHDALTAATLAYERAHKYQVVQENAFKGASEQESSVIMRSGPKLSRQKSIRFVGPNAILIRTHSITRREAPNYSTNQDSPRRSLPVQLVSVSSCSGEDFGRASPREFNENYVASEPSSYRKLRKAKSMFSPGKAPCSVFADRISSGRRPFPRHSTQSSSCSSEAVRVPDSGLRRSYSFVRGVTDRIAVGNRQYASHDAAIQLARDTYLQQLEEQRLKEQPSFLNLSKRQKRQKAFRRTVRTSSTNSYGTAISTPLLSTGASEQIGLGAKVRTLPQTWKEKMKRVFKRASNDDSSIPAQHLIASQPHYGDPMATGQASERVFSPLREPNTELLHRVASRDSSLRSEPLDIIGSSRPGSFRSVGSDDKDPHDKSRVTSWTSSTAANTINMSSFRGRKRLSIITEDGGPHQSTSSTQHYQNLSNGYANFRQPVKEDGAAHSETQRIFSALQKQIHENNRKAAAEESEADIDSSSYQHEGDPPTSSFTRGRSTLRPRIRRMKTVPVAPFGARGLYVSNHPIGDPAVDGDDQSSQPIIETSYDRCEQAPVALNEGLTPQQIADMNEPDPLPLKQPLREVKSAFFPPSTRIERRRTSPYKQAMYANHKPEELVNPGAADAGRPYAGSVIETESVYSRSSSGHDMQQIGSSTSLAYSEGNTQAEVAVVGSSSASGHEPPARPFSPQRYSSAKAGRDWEKFKASEAATFKDDKILHENVFNDFSVKEGRHKRENAQLNEDTVRIGFLRTPNTAVKQPLGVIQGNAIGRPPPAVGRSVSSDENVSARARAASSKENAPIRSPSTSSWKHAGMNEGFSADLREDTISALSHKRSYASLTPNTDTKADSVSKGPKYSPERAQRLRRLKSSNATALESRKFCTDFREAQDAKTSPGQQSQCSDKYINFMPTEAGMNTELVNKFLRERRKEMRLSEESDIDAAFL